MERNKPAEKLKDKVNFYSGTSNVMLPVANKGFFPPGYEDKSRLHYYASLFTSVEINSSFYKIPMPRTVEKWAADVPAHFRFSFKLWRGFTHAKELDYDVAGLRRYMQAINSIGEKKGALLIQFPASIKVSYFHKIKKLLDSLRETGEGYEWKTAIEFRDRSWYRDEVYEMLEHYGATVVKHDMPASATPLIDMDTEFVYIRFHGEKGKYRGSYTSDFLSEYAAHIKSWLAQGKSVFVYFNNSLGDAVGNLVTLNGY